MATDAMEILERNRTAARSGPMAFLGSPPLAFLLVWLLATVIATFFSLILRDSTIIGDLYIPRTNDSFYHARRILDAAIGERGFYQFEQRINPPDGMWIPWPWAYDWVLAKATQLALWFRPGMDPMAFLSFVPVAWIGVNAALFLGAAGAIGMTLNMRILAMTGFALSPLVQMLHSPAMIDHHFIELSFVLATIWLGAAWFREPGARNAAVALGVVLGIAPAFHNGLFLLQLLPLGTAGILWLRGGGVPRHAAPAFGAALLVTTLLVLLPSAPFRNGLFSFGLLSWFHLYVAFCTAAALGFMGWYQRSPRTLGALAGIVVVLLAPLLAQLTKGAAFMSGGASILSDIAEVHSPWRMMTESNTPLGTAEYYSWLLLLAPALFVYRGYRLCVERSPVPLYFAVVSVFGLGMLFLQFRFHYFGLFALIAGTFLAVDELRRRFQWHAGLVFVAAFALLFLAWQPPLRQSLFKVYAIAADPEYQYSISIFFELEEQCDRDPGLVLANNDDGNAILFHSDCSVIANNFVLGSEDDAKFEEIGRLMRTEPVELLRGPRDIKYVFVRAEDFSTLRDGVATLDPSNPIVARLILGAELPDGFELVASVDAQPAPDAPTIPYARLYKLDRGVANLR